MAKKFPDLTGDGKVTQADILKGRGVFKMGGLADATAKLKAKGMKNGGKINNLRKAIKKVDAKKKAAGKNGKKQTMAQRMKALRNRKKK